MGPMLLGNFAGAMLLRVPIGFALALASLITIWLITDTPLAIGAQRIVAGITPFALLAIPLFILAGGIMNAGGITKRLLDLADSIVGGMRGGLAQTNVLSALFFGGISGSAVADISSLGRILVPAMKARDYKAAYTAAVTAAAPIVAPIMPPSITMIVYGVVSGTSIGQLFFAGIIPAILYIAMVMVTVHLTVRKQGFTDELVATRRTSTSSARRRRRSARRSGRRCWAPCLRCCCRCSSWAASASAGSPPPRPRPWPSCTRSSSGSSSTAS